MQFQMPQIFIIDHLNECDFFAINFLLLVFSTGKIDRLPTF